METYNDDSTDYLEKVVHINSGTLNLRGVREVGGIFASSFKELGLETKWIPMPEGMNRAGHLLVEQKGGKGEKLERKITARKARLYHKILNYQILNYA